MARQRSGCAPNTEDRYLRGKRTARDEHATLAARLRQPLTHATLLSLKFHTCTQHTTSREHQNVVRSRASQPRPRRCLASDDAP